MKETTILREDLREGRFYLGKGRNGNVGLWDGSDFLVIGRSSVLVSQQPRKWSNGWEIKREGYCGEYGGCFKPVRLIQDD